MEKTDQEVDDALVQIRRSTAAPIQRFLESVAAARLEEDRELHLNDMVRPSKLALLHLAEGLGRFTRNLAPSLAKPLSMQPLLRIFPRIGQKRARNDSQE